MIRKMNWKKLCAVFLFAVLLVCSISSCTQIESTQPDSTQAEISKIDISKNEEENAQTQDDDTAQKNSSEEEYILPDSNIQKLTESDLESLSKEELRLARNEIYARLGRKFNDEALQDYFESKSWYEGTIEPSDFSEDRLNETEKYNAAFIAAYEEKHKNESADTTAEQNSSAEQNSTAASHDTQEKKDSADHTDSSYILCSECDGLGHCPYCNGGLCPSCGGTGQMMCTSCAGLGHCLYCGGVGYSYSGVGLSFSKNPCIMCHGSGACSRCGNSRTIPCSQCGGSGRCSYCLGLYYCSYCSGRGYY